LIRVVSTMQLYKDYLG